MFADDRLAEALGRAQRAQELLDNELLTETLTAIKRDFERIVFSTNDSQECDYARYGWRAVDLVRRRLERDVENAAVARRKLEDKNSGLERKQFGIV
jgi:hypothetical protein